jgi:hypothetical protein
MSKEFCAMGLTLGQANALAKKLGGMEIVEGILNGTIRFTVEQVKKVYNFLKPIASAMLPATEVFDPKELDRSDVWLSDGMKRFILPAAELIGPLPEGGLHRFDLKKPAYDKQIVSELPENHVLSASEFFARFAKLTALQPNGKRGVLLANGYVNIVYVYGVNGEVFAAGVGGRSGGRQWGFGADQLDDGRWLGVCRVLVATTDSSVS